MWKDSVISDQSSAPKIQLKEVPQAGKYINVLSVGTDLTFAKSVQSTLNTLQSANKDTTYRIFPGISKDKLKEYAEKYQLHSILVEEEFMDSPAEPWLKELHEALKKTQYNSEVPVIYICSKTDLTKTKNIMRAGFTDVFLKPLDQSLFLQKMNLYNKKIPLSDSSLLFDLETAQDIDVGFCFKTKSISEYGVRITCNKPLEIGSVVSVYSSFLEENIAAVVKDAKKISDSEYIVFMMYVGVTPSQTQAIRKYIRTNYAEGKQAG